MAAASRFRTITIFLIPALLAGTGYYFYSRDNQSKTAVPEYATTTVAKGDVVQLVTATGQLDAVLSVDVGSQISGLIVKLHADFNSVVKKDDVIAEIDPATYKQKLRQAEADLASAKASNRLQQLNTERTRELFAKTLVTQQDLDQAEALLAQSNATMLTRLALVENANVDLARCNIRSPIDGMVISKQTEEGKTVAASLNAPVLFTIANDLSKMQITAAVAEADIGAVQDNQAVTFTADAFPNRNFRGKVTQVRNAPKTVSNVVSYDTIISVTNDDLKLRPGMTANVSIIVAKRENVVRVPNSTLRVRMPEGIIPVKVSPPAPAKEVAATNPGAAPATGTPAPTGERRSREGSGGQGGGRRGSMLGADATPEQRQKMRTIFTELGIDFRNGAPTAEQREQLRKRMVEEGLPVAESGGDSSGAASSTRTVYRLPGGNKLAVPEAVSVKVGITDGTTSEIIEGLAEGDVLITSATVPGAKPSAAPAPSGTNPFGGGGRRF